MMEGSGLKIRICFFVFMAMPFLAFSAFARGRVLQKSTETVTGTGRHISDVDSGSHIGGAGVSYGGGIGISSGASSGEKNSSSGGILSDADGGYKEESVSCGQVSLKGVKVVDMGTLGDHSGVITFERFYHKRDTIIFKFKTGDKPLFGGIAYISNQCFFTAVLSPCPGDFEYYKRVKGCGKGGHDSGGYVIWHVTGDSEKNVCRLNKNSVYYLNTKGNLSATGPEGSCGIQLAPCVHGP